MALVRDCMSTELVTVEQQQSVADAASLMRDRRVRHLPVLDTDGSLVGVISHRDLLGSALGPVSWLTDDEQAQALSEMLCRELMTPDVVTTSPDTPLADAAAVLLARRIGCLPVLSDAALVGMLTESDFVRHIANS